MSRDERRGGLLLCEKLREVSALMSTERFAREIPQRRCLSGFLLARELPAAGCRAGCPRSVSLAGVGRGTRRYRVAVTGDEDE